MIDAATESAIDFLAAPSALSIPAMTPLITRA